LSFALGIYFGVFTNFITERLQLRAGQVGLLESLREVPGFLTALMTGVLFAVAESRLAAVALVLGGVGVAATGQAGSFGILAAWSIVWSVGLHVWLALSPALVMRLSREGDEGHGLGRMNRVGSLATLSALALVWTLAGRIPYSGFFLIGGAVMALGGLFAGRVREGRAPGNGPKWVFRRRFGLYYALTLLEGARRQLFQTFAVFALTHEYHTPVRVIARLMLVNTLLTILLAPRVGAWMDRVGERRMLTGYYVALALVCAGYATAPQVWMLYGLYVADSLLFTCSIGLTTYLRRICPARELTASLAMGVTVNHVAAVLVPVTGGAIWDAWGYRTTFAAGIGLAVVAAAVARRIPER
jgi:predicted MFS family arabinose efflux permease